MKLKHTKYFIIFYIIDIVMLIGAPLFDKINAPTITLGMPTFLTWTLGWTLLTIVVMLIQYKMDQSAIAKDESEEQ